MMLEHSRWKPGNKIWSIGSGLVGIGSLDLRNGGDNDGRSSRTQTSETSIILEGPEKKENRFLYSAKNEK